MTIQRIILEMGTGNDLYGEDYTKAAIRAVQDALHHSSITLFRSMGIDRESMMVEVTVGVQYPEKIDKDLVAKQIPFGSVKVNAVKGGLNISHEPEVVSVIATAAVAAVQFHEQHGVEALHVHETPALPALCFSVPVFPTPRQLLASEPAQLRAFRHDRYRRRLGRSGAGRKNPLGNSKQPDYIHERL